MKFKLSNLSLIALLIVLSSLPGLAFRFPFFGKSLSDKVPVTILNLEGCPVNIDFAEVEDKGTNALGHKNIEYTYSAEVINPTEKAVQAVQLLWLREIPFEPYLARKFKVNGVDQIQAGAKQKIIFKLPFDDRSESYFSVWVKKVLFTDGEEWSAAETDKAEAAIPVIESLQDLKKEFDEAAE